MIKPSTEPSYRLINKPANRSFIIKHGTLNLLTRWHYHPEIEIAFMLEGNAHAVIGQRFVEFKKGELLLLGANLPHVIYENADYAAKSNVPLPTGLIIQFKENFLGSEFIDSPEMSEVKKLFSLSSNGIRFSRQLTSKLATQLNGLNAVQEKRKILVLLDILITLAEASPLDYEVLTTDENIQSVQHDEERMMRIKNFLLKNFKKKITIEQMASMVHMSESSFCRYFASRTLKNFTQYLNEIRISYACRLLAKSDYSISDACFESGFNSISYFNRQFKRVLNKTPKIYQNEKRKIILVDSSTLDPALNPIE